MDDSTTIVLGVYKNGIMDINQEGKPIPHAVTFAVFPHRLSGLFATTISAICERDDEHKLFRVPDMTDGMTEEEAAEKFATFSVAFSKTIELMALAHGDSLENVKMSAEAARWDAAMRADETTMH